jgi:hypothetical protein
MASIAISDLRPTGTALFQDAESFLNELTAEEMISNLGGWNEFLWSAYCNYDDGSGKFLYSVYRWG